MKKDVNPEEITIQDCLENYSMKGEITILSNGQVIDIIKEDERRR